MIWLQVHTRTHTRTHAHTHRHSLSLSLCWRFTPLLLHRCMYEPSSALCLPPSRCKHFYRTKRLQLSLSIHYSSTHRGPHSPPEECDIRSTYVRNKTVCTIKLCFVSVDIKLLCQITSFNWKSTTFSETSVLVHGMTHIAVCLPVVVDPTAAL